MTRLALCGGVLHGEVSMPKAPGETPITVASGMVLHQTVDDRLEVLLVHPSGSYNRRAPWGIPKGAPNVDETLEAAARRETLEETGIDVSGPICDLGYVDYSRSKKRVHGYAAPAPADAIPRCASWEVDKAEFIEISRARRIIHPDQRALLDRLERHLEIEVAETSPAES